MTKKKSRQELRKLAEAAVKGGNWIIRADRDGKSHGGFQWAEPGEWTEAPDWNTKAECGGGLHGQDKDHGGYVEGSRLVFCETQGEHISLVDKVKVHKARILLVNELPSNLRVLNDLKLSGTQITELPEGLSVGGYLYLRGTQIKTLPKDLKVKGDIYR